LNGRFDLVWGKIFNRKMKRERDIQKTVDHVHMFRNLYVIMGRKG